MKLLYSQADVARWPSQVTKKKQILERRLGADWMVATDAQGLSLLSLTLQDEGFLQLALGRRLEAVACFHNAVEVELKLLEMGRKGMPGAEGYFRTGCFQELLLAWAIGDDNLGRKMAVALPTDGVAADIGPPDSTYIARALKALSLGQIDDARQFLSSPPPKIDRQFIGYVECLRQITEQQWDSLILELKKAAVAWERFTQRDCAGHPGSVCFIGGAGLLQLARTMSGIRLTAEVDHLPTLLL
jgi:hypothetical protein